MRALADRDGDDAGEREIFLFFLFEGGKNPLLCPLTRLFSLSRFASFLFFCFYFPFSLCIAQQGADNGIGVAAALALLDSPKDAKLPPLECLFTVDEETGLSGAFGLDGSMVKGVRLVNLDTEDWGDLCVFPSLSVFFFLILFFFLLCPRSRFVEVASFS